MADAILLSGDTYQRLMRMLEKWEKGQIIEPGIAMQVEEVGTGYEKLGVNLAEFKNAISGGGGGLRTIPLIVCLSGVPVTHTFVITD